MDITFQIDDAFSQEIETDRIIHAVILTLEQVSDLGSETVSIVITNNETSQALNQQFRGIDKPTDVLSFMDEADPDFPEMDAHLGDIVIAYPIAEAQALAAGHAPAQEIMLLTVHGMLHLLGFDHDTPEQKAEMWAKQQQIMDAMGLGHIQPTET